MPTCALPLAASRAEWSERREGGCFRSAAAMEASCCEEEWRWERRCGPSRCLSLLPSLVLCFSGRSLVCVVLCCFFFGRCCSRDVRRCRKSEKKREGSKLQLQSR